MAKNKHFFLILVILFSQFFELSYGADSPKPALLTEPVQLCTRVARSLGIHESRIALGEAETEKAIFYSLATYAIYYDHALRGDHGYTSWLLENFDGYAVRRPDVGKLDFDFILINQEFVFYVLNLIKKLRDVGKISDLENWIAQFRGQYEASLLGIVQVDSASGLALRPVDHLKLALRNAHPKNMLPPGMGNSDGREEGVLATKVSFASVSTSSGLPTTVARSEAKVAHGLPKVVGDLQEIERMRLKFRDLEAFPALHLLESFDQKEWLTVATRIMNAQLTIIADIRRLWDAAGRDEILKVIIIAELVNHLRWAPDFDKAIAEVEPAPGLPEADAFKKLRDQYLIGVRELKEFMGEHFPPASREP